MIQAVGIDVVDLDRFKTVVERWGDRLLERILTPAEIAHCRGKAAALPSMAVRFAAKEAFIKCLDSVQYRLFTWQSVQVVNAETGKPSLKLNGPLADCLARFHILVSLSHSDRSAVAVVILDSLNPDT
ncbi:MAG TPA: holo-ACP synthase [bacterium]|nr:holo-ACP synthase [bacterium]